MYSHTGEKRKCIDISLRLKVDILTKMATSICLRGRRMWATLLCRCESPAAPKSTWCWS